MNQEYQRFNTDRQDLCHCLRWKGQFILSEPDPTVPACHDGIFWCECTQSVIGPDGQLAEPGNCCATGRKCYSKG